MSEVAPDALRGLIQFGRMPYLGRVVSVLLLWCCVIVVLINLRFFRKNIQQYFIWPTKDETQLEAIYHEVANLIDHDTFLKLYKQATKDPHDFLTIDNNPPKPVLQFRRNFDTFLLHS